MRLLEILRRRCAEVGVELQFATDVTDDRAAADAFRADIVIASDGINSRVRERYMATFAPDVDVRRCRFVWLGTKKRFKAFTFAFEETTWGWFQAHAYQYDGDTSTFIVETPEEVWQKAGLERMSQQEGIAFCERLFARYLDGERLMSNASHLRGSAIWIRFPRIVCRTWVHWSERDGKPVPIVLMGDAAHTAHFSVGSGTKLALEDAIALARALRGHDDMRAALAAWESERAVEVLKIQNAARNSTEWFEHVDRYTGFEAEQFAYSLLTRSQRISHENLRLRDAAFVREDRELVRAAGRRRNDAGAADVHAVHAARRDAAESRRHVADGAVLVRRRHARRLLPRAPRQPRARRRRPRLHRDDGAFRRRAHQSRVRRDVRAGACRGVEAHRRLRAHAHAGEDRAAARARRARRDRRSSAGKTPTSRCPRATGRCSRPRRFRTGRAIRCRRR